MVVGYEGVFGVVAMALILLLVQFLPGQEGIGLREDSLESMHMIMASPVHSSPTYHSILPLPPFGRTTPPSPFTYLFVTTPYPARAVQPHV